MIGYTKGPWELSGKTDWSGNDKVQHMTYVGEIIENHDTADYRGGICRLQSAEHIKGITTEECEANAHLIAAAPDMYEALEAYGDYLSTPSDRGGKNGPKGKAHDKFISLKNAALAKAEGK